MQRSLCAHIALYVHATLSMLPTLLTQGDPQFPGPRLERVLPDRGLPLGRMPGLRGQGQGPRLRRVHRGRLHPGVKLFFRRRRRRGSIS